MTAAKLILVSGATGYVGGRLVPWLLAAGYRVRCLVRDPARLQGRTWLSQVELTAGDVLQPASLVAAMRDVSVVYYTCTIWARLTNPAASGNTRSGAGVTGVQVAARTQRTDIGHANCVL